MLFYRCLLFCSSISASRLAGIIGALFIPVPIGTILCGGGFLVPLHGPASPHRVQNQAASQRPCLVKFGSHSTAATSSSPPTSSRPSSKPTRKPPPRKSNRVAGPPAEELRRAILLRKQSKGVLIGHPFITSSFGVQDLCPPPTPSLPATVRCSLDDPSTEPCELDRMAYKPPKSV